MVFTTLPLQVKHNDSCNTMARGKREKGGREGEKEQGQVVTSTHFSVVDSRVFVVNSSHMIESLMSSNVPENKVHGDMYYSHHHMQHKRIQIHASWLIPHWQTASLMTY